MSDVLYYVLSAAFVLHVALQVGFPKQKVFLQWSAVGLIYLGLVLGISNQNDLIVASFGFVAGWLAALNHYFKGFI